MERVDVHDQLQLLRYSVVLLETKRTLFVFKKYYKSLFLGLFDIPLVNALIREVSEHYSAPIPRC
ncbi:TPA: hypothetical protein N0F65_010694 [Lagenidium giganteum]|uniref:Uncharacterized protein n=1 Tax=Lagenidium giganteum TaxID=4803 RepID=A0AAV2Z8Y2_9STRA|nr:TPA: hypothetical protein N0F65_010694 [Lagenidium giganteum]